MVPILLIDTNYLCHRAFHAIGDLTHGEVGTGAIFGVLRDIVGLQDIFKTHRCAFAFDTKARGHRMDLLPTYKSGRRKRYAEETEDQQEARADFHRQIVRLRRDYLPSAGFNNVFHAPGYEADDIIAQIAMDLPDDDEAVIIASDQDLWQCLRRNVWFWNPNKKQGYSADAFRQEWGLEPRRWADVKALAGCKSDDIPGVPGAGEATVAKWLRRELGAHTKAAKALAKSRKLYNSNIKLVRLPFPGTPSFEIVPDTVTEEKWQALADRLGMHSIRDTMPGGVATTNKGRKRGTKQEGFGLGSA